jgi:predicted dehydrogenase
MLPEMGPPETTIWEYPGDDRSWEWEMADFERGAAGESVSAPRLEDALAALEAVEAAYRSSQA